MIKIPPENILTEAEWNEYCDAIIRPAGWPLRHYNVPVWMLAEYQSEPEHAIFLTAVTPDRSNHHAIRFLCRGVGPRQEALQRLWSENDPHLVLARAINPYDNTPRTSNRRTISMIPTTDDNGLTTYLPLVHSGDWVQPNA